MLDDATVNQLRELRLATMAECFKEQQNTTGIVSLSFEERFGLLVEAEWLQRKNKRTERLIRKADFRFPAVIEDIDYSNKKGITKGEIMKLSLGMYPESVQKILQFLVTQRNSQ